MLAPRLAPSPTSASPTYERCGTFAPAPMSEFLTSTNVPAFAPSRDDGARAQVGERPDRRIRREPRPRRDRSAARARRPPIELSISVLCGPISQPPPTRVAPTRLTPGPIVVSAPISTPASTRVLAGPRKLTPAARVALEDPLLRDRLGLHQPGAVVDAERGVGVGDQVRRDALRRARAGSGSRPAGSARRRRGSTRSSASTSGRGGERVGAEVDLADLRAPRRSPPRGAWSRRCDRRRRPRGGSRGRSRSGRAGRSSAAWRPRPLRSCSSIRPAQVRRRRSAAGRRRARSARRRVSASGARAASTAAPVPSPSRCSTTSIPSGTPSATPSPGRVTHSTRLAPASRAASTTQSSMGLPHTGWRTFGSDERMRVPCPAAMMRTVKPAAMGRSA